MNAKDVIHMDTMSQVERQLWADFTAHEIKRHRDDIERGEKELLIMRAKYGIIPRGIYIGKWIEVG